MKSTVIGFILAAIILIEWYFMIKEAKRSDVNIKKEQKGSDESEI